MQYFRLKQSEEFMQQLNPEKYPVQYSNLKIKEQEEEKVLESTDSFIYRIKGAVETNNIPDFIELPFPLVSTELKKVVEMYDRDTLFVPVVFIQPEQSAVHSFWRVFAPKIKCLAANTKLTMNQELQHFLLDGTKIQNTSLFTIDGVLNNLLIAGLDLAESISRRNFKGIRLEKIPVLEGEKHL